ncbi:MAG: beta-propeller fold lactonase family protein [Rhodocyclales bacterium]|nr:beta-propeller fold lactonase family protein [Rhodocyclales bacterium]
MNPTYLSPARTVVLAACGLALAVPAAADRGIAYVSNQKGNVATISLETFELGAEIDVGGGSPRGIGVTADGRLLVVAARDSGDLAVVDRASGRVVRRIAIGKNPEFVRVRGSKAFVSFEPASESGPPPKPGSPEAEALRRQREADKAEPARIAVVDLAVGRKTAEIVGGMETEGIEFSADGRAIVVTNEADENLSVHDIASGKLLQKIDTKPYGHRPRGIKLAPDGRHYVVTLEHSNKLIVLDAKFKVVKIVATGDTPYGTAFSRDGARLYVALAKGKALQVFDGRSYERLAEYPLGDRCWHFTFTPDDSHVLAACGRSNEVVVIDAEGRLVKRLADQKMPWGVVTYPKSVGSLDAP